MYFWCLLKVNHTVLLSTLGDSSYRFGATYVGAKQMGPAEVRWSCVRSPLSSFHCVERFVMDSWMVFA